MATQTQPLYSKSCIQDEWKCWSLRDVYGRVMVALSSVVYDWVPSNFPSTVELTDRVIMWNTT